MSNFFDSLGIDQSILLMVLIILVAVLIIFMFNQAMAMRRLNRKLKIFIRGKDGQSLEKEFSRKFADIDKLMESKENHAFEINSVKAILGKTLNKYGIVKYDAFDDVGGKLSFVLAMLDKSNTGFILNAIHSRENCFLYIKEIVNGESYIMLSEEEVEALKRAVNFELVLSEGIEENA